MSQPPFPLQAIPLGVGDFFSQRNYTTTFLILGGQTRLLIDCPDPARKVLFEAAQKSGIPTDAGDIHGVLLTHLHGDHVNGLEGFGFWRKMAASSPGRPFLYTQRETLEDLWERRLRGAMGRALMPHRGMDATFSLDDYFDARAIEPGKPFAAGDLEIVIRRSRHPLPCFGCRISYQGRTLGYSGDTDFDPDHIDFLSPSDLIFHETSPGVHTPYESLAALPGPLREKMRLVHMNDEFDRAASIIEPAEAGRVYPV